MAEEESSHNEHLEGAVDMNVEEYMGVKHVSDPYLDMTDYLEDDGEFGYSRYILGEESEPEDPFPGSLEDSPLKLYIFEVVLTERKSRLGVKFATIDEEIYTQEFKLDTEIEEIAKVAAHVMQLSGTERLLIKRKQLVLMNDCVLECFKSDLHHCVILNIDTDTFMDLLTEVIEYKELIIPDLMCVKYIDWRTTMPKCQTVHLFDRSIDKPFIGGYRHIGTGAEYFNAYSQTGPAPPKVCVEKKNHRDTQTYWMRNRKVDVQYSQATQMARSDLHIPNITDKILTAQPYETAEERDKRLDIEGKVRTIQRYFYAWKMRKALKILSAEYHLRKQKELERELAEQLADKKRRRKDLICKVFPRSRVDFGMLFTMAERWKRAEVDRIASMYCGPAKIAELALMLDKEVEVFRAIDKLFQEVKRDNKRQTDLGYLKLLGTPIRFYCSYKYIPISMDTLENQKSREYDVIYQKVVDRGLNEEQRIEALLDLKLALKDDDCEYALELFQLIERGCDLLSRGFTNRQIESLQKRIESLALYHFKQNACFEGLTRHQWAIKQSYMEENLFVCVSCQQMKTVDQFTLNARAKQITICKECKWVDKTAEPWAELSPYRFILQQIRRTERLNNSPSSVAFIIQDRDIHHLITQIWHSHSVISEYNDIYGLRLCRWLRNEDWSPWNCILLTVPEGKAHLRVDVLEKVYEEEFLNHIYNKHALARKHFHDLMPIENKFKSMYKVPSFMTDVDTSGFVDFRKMFRINYKKRIFF